MTRTPRVADARSGSVAAGTSQRTTVETVQTVGAGVLGAGYLFYLFAAAGSFAVFGDVAEAWWLPLSIASVVASGIALLAVSVAARPDLLASAALGCAIAYLAVMAAWFWAWTERPTGVESGSPTVVVWMTMIPELASLGLVLGGRPVLAGVNIVLAGVLSEVVAAEAANGQLGLQFAVHTAWSIAFGSVQLVLAGAALEFARRLDAARTVAVRTAGSRQRHDSYDVDRRRLDALVHDRIIAFLLALRPGVPETSVREAAVGVIDELDHWWDSTVEQSEALDGREFIQRLRTTVSELGDSVVVEVVGEDSASARFDFEVTDAVLDATAEAVRNYYRHAGTSASCVVIVGVDEDTLAVTIADDGRGFDPTATSPARLGLSFGVTGRMAAVPGGSSSIASAPGDGTRIRIRWDRT